MGARTVLATPSTHPNPTKHVDCERQCPYIYYPICATNGNETENRMFVSHCEMNAFNCDAEKSERAQLLHRLLAPSTTSLSALFYAFEFYFLRMYFVFHLMHVEYHRTKHTQCPNYDEFVDDVWLNSHGISLKPPKNSIIIPILDWLMGN